MFFFVGGGGAIQEMFGYISMYLLKATLTVMQCVHVRMRIYANAVFQFNLYKYSNGIQHKAGFYAESQRVHGSRDDKNVPVPSAFSILYASGIMIMPPLPAICNNRKNSAWQDAFLKLVFVILCFRPEKLLNDAH